MPRMILRKLLLPLVLGVLGAAPAVASPRESVKSVVKAKKAAVKATPSKTKRPALRLTRGRRVARRATSLVGAPLSEYRVPDDCSGLVRLAYQSVGIELLSHGTRPGESAVGAIYRRAKLEGALHHHTPKPGDIVFFHETYDRNRDGLHDDGLTHVGIIESVERDGTVVFVHRGGSGVKRSRMNLRFPTQHSQGGRILNDYLRRAEGDERARLTSELFSGYASAARL